MKKLIKEILRESYKNITLNTSFGLTETISGPILNDNFYRWFNGSQVVDDAGNALICYHGSNKNIQSFNSK